jgi:NADH-quinone oxidoreductase subunit M
MGLIVLGIFTFSLTGLQGSLLQMVSHGIYMAGLFLLMGMMRERGASDETADYGGMASSAPVLSAFFLWFLAAGVGFPGFNGFVGEILILLSAYKAWPLLALASLTAFVLGAWYWFTLYNRLFFGPPGKGKGGKWTDLSFREIAVLLPLAALALWMGLGPNRFLRPMEKSLQLSVLERLKPPPAMTDFAAQQRRMQDEVDKDKARGGK